MKNLKKTVNYVKDNKKALVLMGGVTIVGTLMGAVLVSKVTNSIIKK